MTRTEVRLPDRLIIQNTIGARVKVQGLPIDRLMINLEVKVQDHLLVPSTTGVDQIVENLIQDQAEALPDRVSHMVTQDLIAVATDHTHHQDLLLPGAVHQAVEVHHHLQEAVHLEAVVLLLPQNLQVVEINRVLNTQRKGRIQQSSLPFNKSVKA
jgi:hypothetical protein